MKQTTLKLNPSPNPSLRTFGMVGAAVVLWFLLYNVIESLAVWLA